MDSDNEQALLGMDVLSMGDFSTTHFNADDGQQWLRFQFSLLEDTYLF
jgi:hypothetical protein